MLTSERREKLKSYIMEYKTAAVTDVAKLFGVSSETIRRDFAVLEKQGILKRSYGGATMNDRKISAMNTKSRSLIVTDKKRLIVERTLPYIHPHDCIFIDHSTTAATLCERIKEMPLTVVTNSLLVVNALADSPTIKLNCTGGRFQDFHKAFLGVSALEYIRKHKVDKAFVSCRTVNREDGLHDSSESESELRRCVIESASSTFLLVDNSKLNRSSFITTAPMEQVDYLITDKELSSEWYELSTRLGFRIIDRDQHDEAEELDP